MKMNKSIFAFVAGLLTAEALIPIIDVGVQLLTSKAAISMNNDQLISAQQQKEMQKISGEIAEDTKVMGFVIPNEEENDEENC